MMMKVTTKDNIKILNTDKFKLVDIEIYFIDKIDYKNIAAYNLLIRMMVFRNSKYKSVKDFATFKEDNYNLKIGGGYYAKADLNIFSINSACINEQFSLDNNLLTTQINTLKDCLYHPYLTQEVLDEEKENYINDLKNRLNSKGWILKTKIDDYFGHDNPYGVNIYSSIEDIKKVTLDDIKVAYNNLFNMDCRIYVCGKVDENTIIKELALPNLINKDISIDLSYLKDLDEVKNEYQSHFLQSIISLIYDFKINYNDKLYYASNVFIDMFNYDLYKIIREKYNYCYYIGARFNSFLNMVEIVTETECKNLNNLIIKIQEIIDSYSSKDLTQDLNLSKNRMLDSLDDVYDNPFRLVDLYFSNDLLKNNMSVEKLKEVYSKVTKEDVIKVSKLMRLKITSILKESNHD